MTSQIRTSVQAALVRIMELALITSWYIPVTVWRATRESNVKSVRLEQNSIKWVACYNIYIILYCAHVVNIYFFLQISDISKIWKGVRYTMDLQGLDFRLQNMFWSGSSAVEFEILYSHLIMRILKCTFTYTDNIDYVIMYRHLHLFSLIWLMWLWKYVFE